MGNNYIDEIHIDEDIIYGVNFLAVEKNKYVHQDEYLKINNKSFYPKFILRCENVDL